MEEYLVLGASLLLAGVGAAGALIVHQTVWKSHRRRQLERRHFKDKLG